MATNKNDATKNGCSKCYKRVKLDFDFTMAFQPIVDVKNKTVFGYEALVRGLKQESAYSVISQVTDKIRYTFDQLCRVKAIALAAKLNLPGMLSINFLPNAIYRPERCIQTTLEAADEYGFPKDRIMFEFTETERIRDSSHIQEILKYYGGLGFITAIDDFGAGYSGLGLLADFQTDIVKLDMALIRDIHQDKARQTIIENCMRMFSELGIKVLAEGVETGDEYLWLKNMGISLMQGYYFAKPGFECLPDVTWS